MTGIWKKAAVVIGTAGMLVAAAAPAEAQRFRGGRGYYGGGGYGYGGGFRGYRGYRGGGRTGVAIGAGILGLGLGAAIASSSRPIYGGYGYAPPPPPPAYYGYGGYGYYGGCATHFVWDPYVGGQVPVRSCY